MSLRALAALAFVNELEKIGSDLELPLAGVTAKEAEVAIAASFLAPLLKEGRSRSAKEYRMATAAGDTDHAANVARASGQLGMAPRHVGDISEGGGEAGVDLMMGRASNPTTGAVNESGLAARKLYKPDSTVTQGEYTPRLLAQKQQMTDAARGLGPEAKAMVPDMYGHKTLHADTPQQRATSMHEYVPGMTDLRGKNTGTADKPIFSRQDGASKDVQAITDKVMRPLEDKGMVMKDVLRQMGSSGANYGNMMSSPSGPKVVDFIPEIQGQSRPHLQSYVKHSPEAAHMQFNQKGALPFLRKEVFKPQMGGPEAAHPAVQNAARHIVGVGHPSAVSEIGPQGLSSAVRSTRPTNQAVVQKPVQPSQRLQAPAGQQAFSDPFPNPHAPTAVAGHTPTAVAVPPVRPAFSAPAATPTAVIGKLAPPKPVSAITSVVGKLPRLGALHG